MHFVKRCRHGHVVSQCRCAGEKTVEIVECPVFCLGPDAPPAPQDPIRRTITENRIGGTLWRAIFRLEGRRKPGDPSTVPVCDLANVLEEYDVADVNDLRERLGRVASTLTIGDLDGVLENAWKKYEEMHR